MGHKLSIIFLLFIFWIVPKVHSQINFKYYTIQDKLSHNIVYAVEKDTKGLMWFATRNGVDSYDGMNFKHYDLITEKSPYSESNSARSLLMGDDGNLWVGSDKGLLKYDPDRDLFVPFHLKEGTLISGKGIVSMYMDQDGFLWLGSYKHIYVIDPSRQILIRMFENCNYVRQIIQYDKENVIYFSDGGSFLVNRTDHSRIRILNHVLPKGYDVVSTGFRDKDNNFWFASEKTGVFVTDANLNIKRKIKPLDFLNKSKTKVKKIFYLNDTDIGVLTDGEGLIILNKNYEIKNRFTYEDGNSSSLSTNALSDIYIDRDNRLWITTIGGGINLHDPNWLPFYHIKHQPQNENSLDNNFGKAILSNSNGELWFGTHEGISIWNESANKWHQLLNWDKKKNRENKIVLNLEKISDKEIWIGSYGGGVDIYDLESKVIRPIEEVYNKSLSLNMDYILKIYRDSKSNVWISSLRNPLIRFDLDSKKFFTYPVTNVLTVFEAKDGTIYVGTRAGLAIIHENSDLIRFTMDSQIGLSSNYINCFQETKNGKIMMGTEGGGLNIFDPANDSNLVISKTDGLVSNIIHCILPSDEDTYWLSTSKGLSTLNMQTKKVVNYGLADGLPVLSFLKGSGVRLDNGQLIFGGYEGYVKFDPNKIVQHKIPVRLKFLDFKVSNISASIEGGGSPLDRHIENTEQIKLNYLQNSFTFDFIGINYTNPSQNQYSWKLEGFDEKWTPWANNRSATYTNIEAGNYMFKLKVTNPYGLPDVRSLALVIEPPWWLSSWAFICYIVAFLIAVFFIFYFIRIRYNEKHSREKIMFFTNIAHDIKTPLTLIHSPLKRISEQNNLNGESRRSVELAMHNAEKIKSIANQLLDFQKVDLKKLRLNIEEENFIRHIKEISKSFNPLFEKKQINFQLLTEVPVLEFYYDKKIIERIVNNLLSNAIKYTSVGGKVSIKIKVQGRHCILKVSDNGIGIPDSQKREIFKRYFRASNAANSSEIGCGVGLMLVKQLVELLDGKITFTSKENKGTSFTLKLKIALHPKNQQYRKKSKYISVYEMQNKEVKGYKNKQDSDSDVQAGLPKLLVVEDNEDMQGFLKDSLDGKYNVSISSNGHQAFEVVKDLDPDLIVSDVMMPGMDGRVLCHTLKHKIETCHIPVILLTALSNPDHRAEGYEVGADAYIEKPFDMKVLISRIDNLLQIRKTLKGKFYKFDDSPNDIIYQNSLDQNFIAKANEVVQREMENTEFDVELFSKEMNVSRPVLYRKLKALTGQSPHEYILYAKLRHAVGLLRSTQLSIKEISYASGFSNSKYFSTVFKKYFDLTPSEFLNDKTETSLPAEK